MITNHQERQRMISEASSKDIVEVAESLGMDLQKRGRTYIWKEHDSFVIDPIKNMFYWNSQRKGGNPVNLVKLIKACSFKEAIGFLSGIETHVFKSDKEAAPRKFHYYLKDHKNTNLARAYLRDERKLSDSTIDFFESQGVISQASYKNYGEDKTQPVIVFKAMNPEGKIKGMSVQGIWKNSAYGKRGHLKKTHGDGFYGCSVKVGNPPSPSEISENNKLVIIAFEAPIDMMSYSKIKLVMQYLYP